MSTFSPGPWRAVEPDLDRRPEMHIRSANDRLVAIVVQWGEQDYRADARLLAEAPEMYQELAVVVDQLELARAAPKTRERIRALLARIDGNST